MFQVQQSRDDESFPKGQTDDHVGLRQRGLQIQKLRKPAHPIMCQISTENVLIL